ncbi:MAG: glycosyltransferase [Luteitalea sp.]|nr:glycosyltransferase [Luteitalea sp.]
MKTLHVTNAWHPASGGIRTFYLAMLRAANAAGSAMRLIVPAERGGVEEVGTWGRIYYVKAPRAPIVDRRYRVLLPHRYLWPRAALQEILRAEQPDLLEVCDKYALCYLAGVLRRLGVAGVARPTLVGLSCERFDDNVAVLGWSSSSVRALARWYMGYVYTPQFDYHLANSDYTAQEIRCALVPRHTRDVHVVPMGVDADVFGPEHRSGGLREEWSSRLAAPLDAVYVLYAGRLAREKHLARLIGMLEQLPDHAARRVRLVVAGDGPHAPALREAAAARVPGRVLFWGHVADRHALAAFYASADAFVHPNPREPFGIGPLEAMASGLPVIVPNAGGVLSYASLENAWLAAPTDRGLATALDEMLRAPVERAARVEAARLTAERFAWPQVTARIFALYHELHRRRLTVDRTRWAVPLLAHR